MLRALASPLLAAFIVLSGNSSVAEPADPPPGGTLVFGVAGEPNTFDCHATNTFTVLHCVAPHNSTRLKFATEKPKLETAQWQTTLLAGNFDAITDFPADPVDDLTIQLERFTSFDRAPNNASRAIDPTLDDLCERQKRTVDPAERRRLVRAFEDRLLREVYAIPLFRAYRIEPIAAEVEGWPSSPSHFLFQDQSTVWIRQ